MAKGSLICKNIVKKYGNKEVLHNIDLELEPGKIYGLIGRNGAGKTTLLSILTAQNPADSGTVTYNDMTVWENQLALDHLCFSRELNPLVGWGQNNLKVKDYLQAASVYFPYWDKETERRLIESFSLDIKKRICKLSKGMMSMVTIVVAMASKADITILDEPVSGLDVVAREAFYKELIDEYTNTGRTFVISTHIIEEAADLFEETIIIKDGSILLKENTQSLLDRAFHISGKAEIVNDVVLDLKLQAHHPQRLGRSKGVTVLLPPNEQVALPNHPELRIQPVSLQNLFTALCGNEPTV